MNRFRFPGKPQKNFQKSRISLTVNDPMFGNKSPGESFSSPGQFRRSSNERLNSVGLKRAKIKCPMKTNAITKAKQFRGKNQLILRKSRLNCVQTDEISNRTTLGENPKLSPSNCLVCATSLDGGGGGGGSGNGNGVANEFSNEICEFCANFLNKMLESNQILSCTKNNGFCTLLPQKNHKITIFERLMSDRCQACWLTVCLNTLNLSSDRKSKFTQMLPNFIQTTKVLKPSASKPVQPPPLPPPDRLSRNGSGAVRSYCELSGGSENATEEDENDADDEDFSERRDRVRSSRGPRYKNVCRSARTAAMSGFVKQRLSSPAIGNGNEETAVHLQKRRGRRKKTKVATASVDDSLTMKTTLPPKKIGNCYATRKTTCSGSRSITISYWENYDLDEIYNSGFALIMSNEFVVKSICFLCGSAGQDELIYCANCCEPYHLYCIDQQTIQINTAGSAATAATTTTVTIGGSGRHATSHMSLNWFCKRCIPCENCGQVTRYKIQCQKCLKSYHLECFNTKVKLDQSDHNLVCSKCLKCNSCGSGDNNLKLVGNSPYCLACFRLRKKGNFCPICQVCYDNNDYDTMMIECNNCKHWVHAACEKITADEYHVLSNLPQNIDYVCAGCAARVAAGGGGSGGGGNSAKKWKQSVREDFAAKLLNVLRAFSKNRCARQLLKFAQRLRNESVAAAADCDADEVAAAVSLAKIRTKIAKNSYVSLKEFRFDFETVLRSQNRCDSETSSIVESFRRILKEQFPWHSVSGGDSAEDVVVTAVDMVVSGEKEVETAVVTAANATATAKTVDIDTSHERDEITGPARITAAATATTTTTTKDNRFCALCKGYGDGRVNWEGRLLYAAFNEWIHANCALWSAEVYEEIDGSLQNVSNAISRGRLIKCQFCAKKGASIGCCAKLCSATYHFLCARLTNCLFLHDKTVYCPKHTQSVSPCDRIDLKDAVSGDQFCLDRPVFIEFFDSLTLQKQRHDRERDRDRDRERHWSQRRKQPHRQSQSFGTTRKQKFFDPDRIQVTIGSLTIRRLGRFHPKLSDTVGGIVPVHLQCERFYWSISEPWKLVSYSLTITAQMKIVTSSIPASASSSSSLFPLIGQKTSAAGVNHAQFNFRVDHSLPERIVREQLQEIERFHRDLELDKRSVVAADLFDNFAPRTVFDTFLDSAKNCYDHQFKNPSLLQVDGIDDDDDDTYGGTEMDDKPVKCSKCQCTYRTRFSYDRHLGSCYVPNIDFGSSSSGGSGGSEDDSSADESDIKDPMIAAAAATSPVSSLSFDCSKRCMSDDSDLNLDSVHVLKKAKYSEPMDENGAGKLEPLCPTTNFESQYYGSGAMKIENFADLAQKIEPVNEQKFNFQLVPSPQTQYNPGLVKFEPVDSIALQAQQQRQPFYQPQQFYSASIGAEQPPPPQPPSHLFQPQPLFQHTHSVQIPAQPLLLPQPLQFVQTFPLKTEPQFVFVQSTANAVNQSPIILPIQQPQQSQPQPQTFYSTNHPHQPLFVQPVNFLISNQTPVPLPILVRSSPSQPHLPAALPAQWNQSFAPHSIPEAHGPKPLPEKPKKKLPLPKSQKSRQPATKPAPQPQIPQATQLSHSSTFTQPLPPQSSALEPSPIVSLSQTVNKIKIEEPNSMTAILPPPKTTAIENRSDLQTKQASAIRQQQQQQQRPQPQPQSIPVSQPLKATVTTRTPTTTHACTSTPATVTVPSLNSNTIITTASPITTTPTTVTTTSASNNAKVITKSVNRSGFEINNEPPFDFNKENNRNFENLKTETASIAESDVSVKNAVTVTENSQAAAAASATATTTTTAATMTTSADCTAVALMAKTETATVFADASAKTGPSQSQPPLLLPLPLPPPPPPPPPLQQQLPPPSIFRNYYSHSHRSYRQAFDDQKANNRYDLLLSPTQTAHDNCYTSCPAVTMTTAITSTTAAAATTTTTTTTTNQFRFEIKSNEINEQSDRFDDIWPKTVDLVQTNRQRYRLKCLPASDRTHVNDFYTTFGLQSNAVRFLLEQLPGAQKCKKYTRQFDWFFERNDLNNNEKKITDGLRLRLQLRQQSNWKRRRQTDRFATSDDSDVHDDKLLVFAKKNLIFNDCDNGDVDVGVDEDDNNEDYDDNDDDCDDDKAICARLRPYDGGTKKPLDMFSWLASEQRINQLTSATSSVLNQNRRLVPSSSLPSTANQMLQWQQQILSHAAALSSGSLQTLLPLTTPTSTAAATATTNLSFVTQHISNGGIGGSSSSSSGSGGSGGGGGGSCNRQIKERTAKLTSVYPSQIHGYGLYCLEDIECGEMVIQYTGEIVRSSLTDKRERYYCSKNIGCYMFRIDDNFVIDATMKGNAARFINHSCEPNCYSKVVEMFGRKRIFIFALRKVHRGEELTYDYKFPLEEDKIPCTCTSRKCRKYLN